jgi:hypothetical protein
LRYLLTVVLYAGVGFVLVPYLTGHTSRGLKYLLVGLAVSLVAGFARCYFMDGDCSDRIPELPHPSSVPAAGRK